MVFGQARRHKVLERGAVLRACRGCVVCVIIMVRGRQDRWRCARSGVTGGVVSTQRRGATQTAQCGSVRRKEKDDRKGGGLQQPGWFSRTVSSKTFNVSPSLIKGAPVSTGGGSFGMRKSARMGCRCVLGGWPVAIWWPSNGGRGGVWVRKAKKRGRGRGAEEGARCVGFRGRSCAAKGGGRGSFKTGSARQVEDTEERSSRRRSSESLLSW